MPDEQVGQVPHRFCRSQATSFTIFQATVLVYSFETWTVCTESRKRTHTLDLNGVTGERE